MRTFRIARRVDSGQLPRQLKSGYAKGGASRSTVDVKGTWYFLSLVGSETEVENWLKTLHKIGARIKIFQLNADTFAVYDRLDRI